MTPEGKVKRKITATLKQRGVWWTTPAQRGFSKPGVPDYLCLYRGVFFSIEAKAGKNKPTKLQVKEMESIRDNGGYTLVINEENLDQVSQFINSVDAIKER